MSQGSNIENEKRYTQKRLEEFLRKRGYKQYVKIGLFKNLFVS